MILTLLVLSALFVWWRVRRRARAARLAGLTGTAPVFQVEPPSRRMSGIKGERL